MAEVVGAKESGHVYAHVDASSLSGSQHYEADGKNLIHVPLERLSPITAFDFQATDPIRCHPA